MGIRFFCPKGHKLNVKAELAGKMGICPKCGERMLIPLVSTREAGEKKPSPQENRSVKTFSVGLDSTNTPEEGGYDESTQLSEAALEGIGSKYQSNYIIESPSDEIDDNIGNMDEVGQNGGRFSQRELSTPITGAAPVQSESVPPQVSLVADSTVSNSLLGDPNVLWYVRGSDGQNYGPSTGAIVSSWIKEKRIGPTTLVWREGWSTWLEARNVFPELEEILAPKGQLPPEPTIPMGEDYGFEERLASGSEEVDISLVEKKKQLRRRKARRDKIIVVVLFIAIIALLILLLSILFMQRSSTSNPSSKPKDRTVMNPASVMIVSTQEIIQPLRLIA